MKTEAEIRQKEYYSSTAKDYDNAHKSETEHIYALAQLCGILASYSFTSLLDVGAGTGRIIRQLKSRFPAIKIHGIEPVDGLRQIGYNKGLSVNEFYQGNALNIDAREDSWDIVIAFGILHHIARPDDAVAEMCRVAKHGVFFSDMNNFGCGPLPQRLFSQTLHMLRLWRSFQFLKNGFKMEKFSEGDGIHYSYSLFDSISAIKKKFPQTFISGTKGTSCDLYRGWSHISVFAVKDNDALQALHKDLETEKSGII